MSCYRISEETRKKLSDSKKGNTCGLGYRHTEEAKRKIGDAHRGVIYSLELRKRLSEAHMGQCRPCSEETKKKISDGRKGILHTAEARKKMSDARKGKPSNRKGIPLSAETKYKISISNKGKHFASEETREKMSYSRKGNKSHTWRGGITRINYDLRVQPEYKSWRKSIFERDNYTCKMCGIRGGCLHSHHLWDFAKFPDLRLALSNGITLCGDCHGKIHGGRYKFNHGKQKSKKKMEQP